MKFNVPYVTGKEKEYIDEVFENKFFSGNGEFTKRCQRFLEDQLEAPLVLLTHSCTGALEMSAILSDIGPGDEVIMPSFTFVTTASSFMRSGAKPVFCEIDPKTMMIDMDDAVSRITPRTKAIVPVHYSGCSPNMNEMKEICDSNSVLMIEDAAQGLGSSYGGKPLGTFAPLSAISFHETKNIHSGLGGCLIVNDPDIADRAEIIWERGTNRSAFFKGLVDKYSWVEMGSSFYPSELQAAFLLAQLEGMQKNLDSRSEVWDLYSKNLSNHEDSGIIEVIRPSEDVNQNYHMFAILLQSSEQADEMRKFLNSEGVQAVIHYVPLHTSGMGEKMGYSATDLPITTDAASRLLRLPLHSEISEKDVSFVSGLIDRFFVE